LGDSKAGDFDQGSWEDLAQERKVMGQKRGNGVDVDLAGAMTAKVLKRERREKKRQIQRVGGRRLGS